MVTKNEIIDIIEIIYFVPALPLALWVCKKHGFSREAGWLLLVIISLVRIIGAALSIAATKEPNNSGLLIGSVVLAGIGSATLVAAFTGIVNRVDTGSKQSPLPPRVRRYLQLMSIAAIVLGSVGASNGIRSLTQAAIILILIQFLVSTWVLSCSALHFHAVLPSDRILFFCTAAAVPFVLVRCIYSVGTAFSSRSSDVFSLSSDATLAVVLRGVLAIGMEIVSISLFIIGGLTAPRMELNQNSGRDGQRDGRNIGYQQPSEQYLASESQYKQGVQLEPVQHQSGRY